MGKDDKERVLNVAISQVEKQFGKGSIMRLGDKSAKVEVDVISTGSLGLDSALGIGGFPRGRVVEIYGPEAGGKTTLALEAIAQAQKAGGTAMFIDAEHALDLCPGAQGVSIHRERGGQPGQILDAWGIPFHGERVHKRLWRARPRRDQLAPDGR